MSTNPQAATNSHGADSVARVVGRGEAGLAAARARLDALRRTDHAALCVPWGLEMGDGGAVVAHAARIEGVDLDVLTRTRDGLTTGECVTVGVAIAEALAALHRLGLAHGDVSPSNIVVPHAPGGGAEAVLIDVMAGANADERGTPGFSAPERAVAATPAGDVFSLGRVLLAVVGAADRERIAAWVEPMCAPRAADRPTADECARALAACAEALPVRTPGLGVAASVRASARVPLPRTVRRPSGRVWRVRRAVRAWSRRVLIVGAGLVGAGVLFPIVAGAVGGHGSEDSGNRAPSSAIFGRPPEAAAADLVQRRLDALAASDADALLATTVATSPARADDVALADALRSGEVRFDGWGAIVGGAELVAASDGAATVRVTYAASAHVEVDASGEREVPASLTSWDVDVSWGAGGWKIVGRREAEGTPD